MKETKRKPWKILLSNFAQNLPIFGEKIRHYYSLSDQVVKMTNAQGFFESGHYHSPVPDIAEIERTKEHLFAKDKNVPEVDFNDAAQLSLLEKIKLHQQKLPYSYIDGTVKPSFSNLRYNPANVWYHSSDAIFLFGILMEYRPSRIIEVGSGYSSSLMLDTNDLYLDHKTSFTFIEPNPKRLYANLREADKKNVKIIEGQVQKVDLDLFKSLEENDILFIDSSHVSKIGSDLNFILFEILPILKKGVIIHFHDIFYPFEMPRKWILDNKWFWNENYLIRAFMAHNNTYSVLAFNSYLQYKYRNLFTGDLKECLIKEDDTGSIWLRKN